VKEKANCVRSLLRDQFLEKICNLKNYDPIIKGPIFEPSEVTADDEIQDDMFPTKEADEYTPEAYDEYLLAQVVLPKGDHMVRGKVVRRLRDSNGNPIGKRNLNPILDTREYEVLFPDGSTESYLANAIAENLYSQVDGEGKSFTLLEEIMDHERDSSALTQEEITKRNRHTTKDWKFLVLWKDGMTSYVPLREMKNSYPVETADYAVEHELIAEPAFAWWVPYERQKQSAIVSKLNKSKTKY